MINQKINLNEDVTRFLNDLNHPFRNEIEALRTVVLLADTRLNENIKWNGPNYSFENRDCITMRIHPPKKIQLIFHRGAKVQQQPPNRLIKDESSLLAWKENDRAVITFESMDDIEINKLHLAKIVKAWTEATFVS